MHGTQQSSTTAVDDVGSQGKMRREAAVVKAVGEAGAWMAGDTQCRN